MKSRLLIAALGLLLTACAATPAPTRVQARPSPRALPSATASPDASPTPSPTFTPIETAIVATVTPVVVTATATPTPTPLPSLTPVPQPSLRQLTSGSCCTRPFWSPDSRQVRFIDRPPSRPQGIYGVDARRSSPPILVTDRIVTTSGNGDFYVYPQGDLTIVQRAATGEQYVIPNGGRAVSVSPDGQRLLWQVTDQRGGFDRRYSQTWVANVDGSEPRIVAETVGVSQSQWVDERRVLLVGLPLEDQPYLVAAAVLTLETESGDQWVEIARIARPRGMLLSPQGGWLAYLLTFQSIASNNGLWLVPTDGSQAPHKIDFFGSYRWRDDARLIYVPLDMGVESHTLWEYDALNAKSRRLTDPARTSFKIANDDWAVSPDGRYIVFVGAGDHNLWLMDLQAD